MLSFDATSREVCTARRERTATPLQALVLLNDPQFVEAARLLAGTLLRQHGPDKKLAVEAAFRMLTSRTPAPKEIEILMQLYGEQQEHFRRQPDDASAFLAIGESPRDEKLDAAELAAWTMVANAILNLDEVLTRN